MKISRSLLLAVLFPAILASWSCEKNEMFKSESKIKKQLVGSWNLIPIPRTNPNEVWTFDNSGNAYLFREPAEHDTGTYEIKTTLTKVELKIKDLEHFTDFATTWQVVLLDDEILVMANDHLGATGIKELDFQKRN